MSPQNWLLFATATTAGLVGAIGDGFLNYWAKGGQQSRGSFVLGILAWNVALVLFARLLTASALPRAVILFLVANAVSVSLISAFYFRERVGILQWVGMAIALAGIVVMEVRR